MAFAPQGFLLQEPDRERVAVAFLVTGLHRGDDDADKPDKQDDGQNDEADKHKAETPCNQTIDRVGNLEVDHLLARGVDLRAVGALHKPYHQRDHDMKRGRS